MTPMTPAPLPLPRYDPRQSYDWNYQHAPLQANAGTVNSLTVSSVRGAPWDFCGLKVDSPLGVAAGPLLNGRWVLYYASLGFDVLTYKTVRTVARASYDPPNLQPVHASASLHGSDHRLPSDDAMRGSWAVSFGMPSRDPAVWRADVAATRKAMPVGKVLSVSVVATPQREWTTDQLAEDYATCARWAVDSGADCVEANFSCPNVASCDGDLYQRPTDAEHVAARLRAAVGARPLLVKLGHVPDGALADELLSALAPHVDGLVMVNTVAARVTGAGGEPMFGGQKRGIAGDAIREAALAQVRLFAGLVHERRLRTQIIGVGGISSATHVTQFLAAGCRGVQLATAAMLDPEVALSIRRELAPPQRA
jgi:dihydroorotate dehydrogenase